MLCLPCSTQVLKVITVVIGIDMIFVDHISSVHMIRQLNELTTIEIRGQRKGF